MSGGRRSEARRAEFTHSGNFVLCGGAASAPSEEGAGAPKGYKGATEGEITRACCLHRGADEDGAKKAVICLFSCLYQVLSHILGVSLPPSACSNPLCRHPPPSSEGGEGAPAPCSDLLLVSTGEPRMFATAALRHKRSQEKRKEVFYAGN